MTKTHTKATQKNHVFIVTVTDSNALILLVSYLLMLLTFAFLVNGKISVQFTAQISLKSNPLLVHQPTSQTLDLTVRNSLVTWRKRVKANSRVEQYYWWMFLMQKARHILFSKPPFILY